MVCYISTMKEDKQDKRKNDDDLEDLLTEAAQQTAIRAAQKRKAVENILLRPSMLKMLDELVTDLAKESPEDTGEEVDKVSRNPRLILYPNLGTITDVSGTCNTYEWLPLQFPHVVLTPGIAGTFGNVLHPIYTLTNQSRQGQT